MQRHLLGRATTWTPDSFARMCIIATITEWRGFSQIPVRNTSLASRDDGDVGNFSTEVGKMILSTIVGTKIAAVVASAVVAAGGLTGLGFAADDAVPGDTLYGLDCAMERIGLGDGGVQERVREAEKLVRQGEVEKGLNHAAEALRNQAGLDKDGEANGALVQAANSVQNAIQTANQGESDQIRARVAEMLQWMSQTMAQDRAGEEGDFGQGVAERARVIAGEAEQIRTGAQAQSQTQTQLQNQDDGQGQNLGQEKAQDQTQDRTQIRDQSRDQSQDREPLQDGEANQYQYQNGVGGQGNN